MKVADVIEILKNGSFGSRVYFAYPLRFDVLPVCSVYTINARELAYGDDTGLNMYEQIISVDIYTKSKVEELVDEVIDKIYNLKSARLFARRDLAEEDGIFHINLEFLIGGV
ncbi:MAG: hypothetical protein QXF86_03270 [Candidatus Bilamarchaeaceae archaeon]